MDVVGAAEGDRSSICVRRASPLDHDHRDDEPDEAEPRDAGQDGEDAEDGDEQNDGRQHEDAGSDRMEEGRRRHGLVRDE